jgi:hypothetical protein
MAQTISHALGMTALRHPRNMVWAMFRQPVHSFENEMEVSFVATCEHQVAQLVRMQSW